MVKAGVGDEEFGVCGEKYPHCAGKEVENSK